METEITVLSFEDWEGIYLNNVVVSQGHSIRLDEVLEHLVDSGITYKFTSYKQYSVSDEQMKDFGWSLPKELTENILKDLESE